MKLSKVHDSYSLLSASGAYHHCLQKHAKYSPKFRLCCLWLCTGGTDVIKQLLVTLSMSISPMGWLVTGWVNSLVRLPIATSFFLHFGTRCGCDVSNVQENLSPANTCLCFRWPQKDMCKGGRKPAGVGDLNLSPVTRAGYLIVMWQRGFWFVLPLSACVSWTIRNIPAPRNHKS